MVQQSGKEDVVHVQCTLYTHPPEYAREHMPHESQNASKGHTHSKALIFNHKYQRKPHFGKITQVKNWKIRICKHQLKNVVKT